MASKALILALLALFLCPSTVSLGLEETFSPPSLLWETRNNPPVSYPWALTTERARCGTHSYKSPGYGDNLSRICVWTEMPIKAGEIRFWWSGTGNLKLTVGYYPNYPDRNYQIGSARMFYGSPGTGWREEVWEIPDSLVGRQHGFYMWSNYRSDFYGYAGTVYIDCITFPPGSAPSHYVSIPGKPSGPSTGTIGISYTYSTAISACSQGHSVQYRFDWGDGTYSSWGSSTRSKSWSSSGTYQVRAQARCVTNTSVVSGWSPWLNVTVEAPHTVSIPTTPSGPSTMCVDVASTYTTGGATCSQGHALEYQFEAVGIQQFAWRSTPSISLIASAPMTFQLRVRARCSVNNSVMSGWSGTRSATVYDTAISAPTGVSASKGSHGDRVRVTWNAANGATKYEIYRATEACGTYAKIGESTGTTYDNTGVTVLRVYWYKVSACNPCGFSALSSAQSGYAGTPGAGTAAVFRVDWLGNVRSDGSFYGACYRAGSADVAEWVLVSEAVEPGDVLELDPAHPLTYRKSSGRCSSLVAGVVSTQPGLILGTDLLDSHCSTTDDPCLSDRFYPLPTTHYLLSSTHHPLTLLALAGIVPVKVTNEGGAIQPGDLLVASSTPGHAMRWDETDRGCVSFVGKALEPMNEQEGVILVLLTSP